MLLLLRPKRRLRVVALVLVLEILFAPSLLAQSQDVGDVFKERYKTGNSADTIQPPDDAKAQEFRHLIGRINRLYEAGKSAEAIPLAEQAIALAKSRFGEEHTDVAKAVGWLGVLLTVQGRFDDAEPLLKRALAIREKVLPAGDPAIAIILNFLGELYREQGRLTEAEAVHKRALAMREKALPDGHSENRRKCQQPGPGLSSAGPLCGSRAAQDARRGDFREGVPRGSPARRHRTQQPR